MVEAVKVQEVDAGSRKPSEKGVFKRRPYVVILIVGVVLLFFFTFANLWLFHHIIDIHKRIDGKSHLSFISSRVLAHVELSSMINPISNYLRSFKWLAEELHDHQSLYGVLIREGERELLNTFHEGFHFSEEIFRDCFNGIERENLFFCCKVIEVQPERELFLLVAVDVSREHDLFRFSLVTSGSILGIAFLIFVLSWFYVNYLVLEQSRLERKLIASEKLAFTGRLSSMIAHEIRNPLNAISMAVQYMSELKEFQPELAEILKKEVSKLKELSTELFSLKEDLTLSFSEFPLKDMIVEIESKFALKASQLGLNFRTFVRTDVIIKADRKWLSRALENLLNNAFEAVQRDVGRVELIIERKNSSVVFSVRDNGKGLKEGEELLIFEPFYTTKKDGFGLGLYIVKKVAEAHGGYVTIERPRNGSGAIFNLAIPVDE